MFMKKRKLHFKKLISLFITFTMLLFLSGNTFAQKKQMKNVIDKKIVQKKRTIKKLIPKKPQRSSIINDRVSDFYEDFANGIPATWTVLDADGDGNTWYSYSGTAGSDSWDGSALTPDNWLITPQITFTQPRQLAFWVYDSGYNEYYSVSISTTGTDPADFTDVLFEGNATGGWTHMSYDISAYQGTPIHIAFRHFNCTDGYYMLIDDVEVKEFESDILDLSFGDDQRPGTTVIDDVNHIVTAEVYGSSDITSLAPDFTLSPGAQLSPTTEWYVGGVVGGDIIPHDFTDTVNADVFASDGVHHKLWKIKANHLDLLTGNDLSNFDFGPNQVGDVWYDNYARRVEAKVPYAYSLVLEPTFENSEKSIVKPVSGTRFDFTTPHEYTVVSESKDTVTWTVTVTNAAMEQDADISAITVDNQVGDAVIGDSTILVYVSNDKPFYDLNIDITISQFAKEIAKTANYGTGHIIYTIQAQDPTVVKDWDVHLVYADIVKPLVTPMFANMDTLTNVGDTAQVKTNENPGEVALVLEGKSFSNLDDLDNLVDNYKAVYTEIAKGESIGALSTENLVVGNYLAYALDSVGNISDASEDTLAVVIGTKEVATIGDLWEDDLDDILYNMQYKLTGEAVISFMQSYRGQKYIQDTTAGILIDDNDGIITSTYAQYDGITGLTGTLKDYYGLLEFIPVEDPGAASSTANTIEPKIVNLEEFNDNQQDYQSQLIKINNVNITSTGTFANGQNYDINDYTSDGVLRSHFHDVNYIGDPIPDSVVNIVGIAIYDWNEAKIAPRDSLDFTGVAGPMFYADNHDFEKVLVGDTISKQLMFGNIGNDSIVFDSVKMVADTTLFSFVGADATTLLAYEPDSVIVTFTPDSVKEETALLVFYYDTDKTYTDTITGTGYANPVWTVGSSENFEKEGYKEGDTYASDGSDLPVFPPAGWHTQQYDPYVGSGWEWEQGWYSGNNQNGAAAHSGELTAVLVYGIGSLETPEIDLSGADVKFPAIEFYSANYFGNYDDFYVAVSTDNTLPMNQWDRYEVKNNPTLNNGESFAKNTVQLSKYKGQHIWVRFYAERTSGLYLYEFIDDVSIIEFPTTPVFAVSANPVDFGATNTDVAVKQTFKISNQGVSFITVDTAYVVGTDASMFTIPADSTSITESYDASVMSFDINFTPTTIGKKTAQLIIKHSDARDANLIDTVELVGYRVNCEEAMEAVVGTNNAPYAPSWYKFTPDSNCVVSVIANTKLDTYLKVYDACGGTQISDNDDVRGTSHQVNADYDAASAADFYGEAGHTYYIYWTDDWGGNGPFEFTLSTNTHEGAICETAVPVTLPMYGDTAYTGSTELTGDFYDDDADLCNAHYLGGNDFVYTFTIDQAVLLSGSIDNAYAGMHIVTKPIGLFGAATESSATCAAFAYYDTKSHPFTDQLLPAGTYYVVVSTWPKPQFTDFTIHLTTKIAPYQDVVFNVNMNYAIDRGDFNATDDFMDVAGTINNWGGSDHMTDTDGDGIYTITYPQIATGDTIEYKYRINGDWDTSEFPNGGPNRQYVVVGGQNILNDIYDDDTTGVGELSLVNRISVYPNPNTGRFIISINSNNSENIVIELVNIQGQKVYRKEIKNVTNSFENINISKYAKGIYYLRVNNGTDVAIRKVVVQ